MYLFDYYIIFIWITTYIYKLLHILILNFHSHCPHLNPEQSSPFYGVFFFYKTFLFPIDVIDFLDIMDSGPAEWPIFYNFRSVCQKWQLYLATNTQNKRKIFHFLFGFTERDIKMAPQQKGWSTILISGRENSYTSPNSSQFNTEININFISLIKVLYFLSHMRHNNRLHGKN